MIKLWIIEFIVEKPVRVQYHDFATWSKLSANGTLLVWEEPDNGKQFSHFFHCEIPIIQAEAWEAANIHKRRRFHYLHH